MKTEKKLTLTALQIFDLASFVGDSDSDTEISIEHFPEPWKNEEDGKETPAGLYAYITEYPEEGVYGPLGGTDEPNTEARQPAPKSNDSVTPQ